MRHPLIFFIILLATNSVVAQRTVSGYIKDQDTGESLVGATIVNQKNNTGTTTNNYGYFSVRLTGDTIHLMCSYVGYVREDIRFVLKHDTLLNVLLANANHLDEIMINAEKAEHVVQSSSMSRFTIPVQQIKALPSLFGERDVMKILQLLPGVQAGNEGGSGLYVRGGGPDQNLILLDGVPVYNASHLYGFFSAFNSDAISHVELIKGGFPARYGGRTSSVVDIGMKEGNNKKLSGSATAGLISSKAMLEGPIGSKTTFLVAARRSYFNLLRPRILSENTRNAADKYHLYDLNFKINRRINEKNRIYFSSYAGGDKAGSESGESFSNDALSYTSKTSSEILWGNRIAALRWNHVFKDWLFVNVSATYNSYNFSTASALDQLTTYLPSNVEDNRYYISKYGSGIQDMTLKADFDYAPNEGQHVKFGAGVIDHSFTPGVMAVTAQTEIENQEYTAGKVKATEVSAYIEDDVQVTKNFRVNIGLHASLFNVEGENYKSVQPRVSARYLLNSNTSVKASYAMMTQFMHFLTNAGVGLPNDLWVPSTARVKPQTSGQWALGFAKTIDDEFEVTVEGYYKTMKNVIEYKDGASYLGSDQDWQNKIETGRGESYGAEVFVQKKFANINGWIGYTLSWTNRQFDNLNRGEWFPYRYDRRHDAKIALSYPFNDHWDFGVVWVYGTGNAVTVPLVTYPGARADGQSLDGSSRVFNMSGSSIDYTVSRNGFRMRAYHRLDLNASYKIFGKKLNHELTAGIYNAYGRKNPYYIGFDFGPKGRLVRQYNLFAVIPSFSYTIKF